MSHLLELWTVGAGQVEALLASAVPTDVVAALSGASDAELESLVRDDGVRAAVLGGLLDRLHEYAVPGRLAALDGVLGLELVHRGRSTRHRLLAKEGRLLHEVDLAGRAGVDVVLTTDVVVFLRLVAGARNAGLEYLAGRVDITGDAPLALAFGGIFRVPGTEDVAMDPTTLDPAEVAAAVATVRPAHLSRVMASGFRPMVLDEIFRRLPEHLDHRKAGRTRLSVGFRLLGSPDGRTERYVVHVADGVARTERLGEDAGSDRSRDARDATITCDAADFLRLATGHLNAVRGVLRGQLKVRGDRAKALQLASILTIPQAP